MMEFWLSTSWEISSHPCFPLDADATLEAAMHPELEQAVRLLLRIAAPAKYYMVPRPTAQEQLNCAM